MHPSLLCGAASRDITPTQFPMARGPMKPHYFGGVLDPLAVRAIALEYGGAKALFVSFDLPGSPNPRGNVQLLAQRTGIPEAHIMYTATHAHAAPFTGGRPMPFSGPDSAMMEEFIQTAQAYTAQVQQAMLEAVDQALASLRPATLRVGHGQSFININRNVDFTDPKTGEPRCSLGFNPLGPSDKKLEVLRFDAEDGQPIAFYINYPCHGVVMHGNEAFDGMMGISGDIPGMTSGYVEARYPGAVALWTSGAAGDQNPILMSQQYRIDGLTHSFTMHQVNDHCLLETIASWHAQDVFKTMDAAQPFPGAPCISGAIETLHNPGRKVLPGANGDFSYEEGGDYAIRMQLLRIGDVALVGCDGELYVSHALAMQAQSPLATTMIVTHNVSDFGGPCYIHDDDAIARHAFASDRSAILPGHVRDGMCRTMLRLFDAAQ